MQCRGDLYRAIGKTAIQRHRCEEMCTERVLSIPNGARGEVWCVKTEGERRAWRRGGGRRALRESSFIFFSCFFCPPGGRQVQKVWSPSPERTVDTLELDLTSINVFNSSCENSLKLPLK